MNARYTLIVGTKDWSSWSLRPYVALRAVGAAFDEIVVQLRQELVIAGLRWFSPEETGCLQNIYCEEPSEPYIP